MKTLKTLLKDFLAEEGGQDVIEYSLLLTLIGLTSVFALTVVGINIVTVFDRTLAKLRVADAAVDITNVNNK
ncbi:MAG: Flp family type IVb pilin [Acidobacteria bacterium]|nr:Flp family type IVb pilin [Acidobacteriota bacterium]